MAAKRRPAAKFPPPFEGGLRNGLRELGSGGVGAQDGGLWDGAKGVDPPVLHQLVHNEDANVFRKRQALTEAVQECLILSLRIQLVPGSVRNDDQRVAGPVGQGLNLLADQVGSLYVGLRRELPGDVFNRLSGQSVRSERVPGD
jgi:hypothetical protein